MPGVLNTQDNPYYRMRSRLDGRDYVLDFSYNEREERWYLDIYDEAEVPLAMGLKLIANWSLLFRYRYDPRMPQGEMVVADTTGDGTPPTLLELGINKRCELIYWSQAEMEAIAEARGL